MHNVKLIRMQSGEDIMASMFEDDNSDQIHPGRSGQQNKMFHAILGQIARQATHLGSKWTTDDWKRLHLYILLS